MSREAHGEADEVIDSLALPSHVSPHPKALVRFAVARFFERLAFYSMSHWLIVFLMAKTESVDTVSGQYQYFHMAIGAVMLSMLLGGLCIDLFYSRRKAVVWGGVLLATGYFVLALNHPVATVLAVVLCCVGMGLYGPGSVSALGSFYRSRQQFLTGGMYSYFAFANAAALGASIFMGYAAMHLNWQQGGMLAGILMMTGHVYLLVISKVFQESKLPPLPVSPDVNIKEDKRKLWYQQLPVLIVAMFCFAFFAFAIKLGHGGVSVWARSASGMRDWSHLSNLMIMLFAIVAALAGSSLFTRHQVAERVLIGYGLMAAIFAGLIIPGYMQVLSPSLPASVHVAITLLAILSVVLAEFLVLSPMYSLVLRSGGKYTNTLIGLVAVLTHLPYFAILIPTSINLNSAGGLAFVLVAVPIFVLGGWWLLKRNERAT